jgi:hypothetical protein
MTFNQLRSLSRIFITNTLVDESLTFLFNTRNLSTTAIQVFWATLDITGLAGFRSSTGSISFRLISSDLRGTFTGFSSFAHSEVTFFGHATVDNVPGLTFEYFFAHIVHTFNRELDVNTRRTANTSLQFRFVRISFFLTFRITSQGRTLVEVGGTSTFQLSTAIVNLFKVRFLIESTTFSRISITRDLSTGIGNAFVVETTIIHLVRHQMFIEVTLRNFGTISVETLDFISIATRTDSTSVTFVIPRFTSDSRTTLIHTGVFFFRNFGQFRSFTANVFDTFIFQTTRRRLRVFIF